jgi:hypothetical protein
MVLGSGIRDPRSGIRKKPIPDPGSRIQGSKRHRIPDPGVKKAPDPGSGSATLGWVIEIGTFTVPVRYQLCYHLYTVFYLLIAQEKKAKAAELAKELAERQKIADTAARLKVLAETIWKQIVL